MCMLTKVHPTRLIIKHLLTTIINAKGYPSAPFAMTGQLNLVCYGGTSRMVLWCLSITEVAAVEPEEVTMQEVTDELPKTASGFYEILFAGLIMLVIGGAMTFSRWRNS